MTDLLEQVLTQIRSAWRYRWWGLAVAWAICIAGWAAVSLQQPSFEAAARVYVDTKSMLRTLLDEQIVDSTLDEQLGFVREAMLGTAQLESIARDLDLVAPNADSGEISDAVSLLKNSIQITSLNDSLPRAVRLMRAPAEDTYTITYRHTDRNTAVNVVSRLLKSFEENAILGKRTSSEEAGVFLRNQIEDYEQRLSEAEERLASFNKANYDRLPNLQGGYFRELQTQTLELAESQKNLSLVNSRIQSIDQQLRGDAWLSGSTEVDPTSTEGRLRATQNRLDELLLRYTDSHPDIIALNEALVTLKATREEELERLSQGDAAVLSNNAVYQAVQISKNEAETERATLEADVRVRQARLDHLRGLINEMPEIEGELSKLNRDYDVINSHYQSLLNNLERERLSSQVVASDDIEFSIIDPPAAPSKPVSLPLQVLHAAVFFAALAGAGAVAFLLAQFSPVVSSVSDITRNFDIEILGVISRNATTATSEIMSHLSFFASLGCLGIALIAVLYFETVLGGLQGVL